MTRLKGTPAGQNLLAEPAPQAGTPGPVSLVLGTDFAGVRPPPAPQSGKTGHGQHGHGKPGRSSAGSGSYGSPAFVQTRNAGASICSGLPAANRNSGSPP
jgi:hypothetical protein